MRLMDRVIDGLEFARRDNRTEGSLPVAGLLRVAEYLASSDGTLECAVQGGRSQDGSGHFELRLTVSGNLQLRCQRCLEAMHFPLRLEKRLRLIAPGAAWPEEDVENEGVDAIAASREMVIGTLIEDEVLLALPISPRHEICGIPQMKNLQQDASPFAVLRKLKVD